jgi:hypothetical protein
MQRQGTNDRGFPTLATAIEQYLTIGGQQKRSLPGVGKDAAGLKDAGRIESQGE